MLKTNPSRTKALSLFSKARDMLTEVVQYHKGKISSLEADLKHNKSELEASESSLAALDSILGKKK